MRSRTWYEFARFPEYFNLAVRAGGITLALKEKIAVLEKELGTLLGGVAAAPKPTKTKSKQRKISAAGRARIRAAQKARWAKIKQQNQPATITAKPAAPALKKKFTMSAAAKAKIAAAAKARWAKIKSAKS